MELNKDREHRGCDEVKRENNNQNKKRTSRKILREIC